jgi:hypothetical protein
MLTIFTIPKPFVNKHISIIQENAIKSWKFLSKNIDVVLIGNDKGVKKMAKATKSVHIPNVACNRYGTPLLNSAFSLAKSVSRKPLLCYLNADIILTSSFLKIFKYIPTKQFLLVGQRWDLDVKKLINYKQLNWESKLEEKVKKHGRLHKSLGKAGSDYFIFNKNSFTNLPAFAVGRVGWDNWIIYKARKDGLKVIDATPRVRVIHQNHDYLHQINKGINKRGSEEGRENINLAGGENHLFNLEDCNYQLAKSGVEKKGQSVINILKYIKSCPEILPGKSVFWLTLKPAAVVILWLVMKIKKILHIVYRGMLALKLENSLQSKSDGIKNN